MNLRDYMYAARRRWKIIVGCVVVTLAAAVLVTSLTTPTYSSSAGLFVSTARSGMSQAYEGSLFSAQRVASYADLVKREAVTRGVIARTGLAISPSELSKKITATVVPDTVILDITVTDTNPRQAQRLAQAVAAQLSNLVANLETPPNSGLPPVRATIVDPASLPTTPTSPNPLENFAFACLFGLFLGAGATALREVFDDTLRGPRDVTDPTEASVMGTIAYDAPVKERPLVTELESNAQRVENSE